MTIAAALLRSMAYVDRHGQRIAPHLAQSVDLAIVAAADPAMLRAHARTRGRAAGTTYAC